MFLGKNHIGEPPPPPVLRKFELRARQLDQSSVNTGPLGVRRIDDALVVSLPRVRPAALAGVIFYILGPVIALSLTAGRSQTAIVCQSPYEGFGVLLLRRLLPSRYRPPVQIEIHADWKAASRMYGSRARRLVSPIADRACEWVVRRADRVRPVSTLLEDRVREVGYAGPIDRFITFSDYSEFFDAAQVPLPTRRQVAFVGVLEPYKAVDVLLDAWALVARAVPDASLVLAGAGPKERALREQVATLGIGESVHFVGHLSSPAQVRELLDESMCMVLPSRSEGLARVVVEAMARSRPVVASQVGGIAELIDDRVDGRLVPCEDVAALAAALVDTLSNHDDAVAMGQDARRRAIERGPQAEWEAGIGRMADWIRTTKNGHANST